MKQQGSMKYLAAVLVFTLGTVMLSAQRIAYTGTLISMNDTVIIDVDHDNKQVDFITKVSVGTCAIDSSRIMREEAETDIILYLNQHIESITLHFEKQSTGADAIVHLKIAYLEQAGVSGIDYLRNVTVTTGKKGLRKVNRLKKAIIKRNRKSAAG